MEITDPRQLNTDVEEEAHDVNSEDSDISHEYDVTSKCNQRDDYLEMQFQHGAENNIIVQYMRSKMGVENILSQEVLSQRWNRRKSMLKPLTAFELLDFLRLSEDQLKIFFTGSYQFSQALSYLAELLDEQNNLSIQYVKSAPNIIKAKVKSKHKNSKVYRIYIDYISNGTDYNSIQRYCCDCPNGNRKVGCCSYVAAIIYYLSYGRYLSKILRPPG
ncbi:Protein of unknown function [Cotesia congregata]|uniref:SWIM-type domain-containing protein n=1 Tax=Cotesia congregata TaxID=51543 RepID=A0A8J2HEN2_COTCN|nr:Protein of unknown function [Cotesia congregata]